MNLVKKWNKTHSSTEMNNSLILSLPCELIKYSSLDRVVLLSLKSRLTSPFSALFLPSNPFILGYADMLSYHEWLSRSIPNKLSVCLSCSSVDKLDADQLRNCDYIHWEVNTFAPSILPINFAFLRIFARVLYSSLVLSVWISNFHLSQPSSQKPCLLNF